MKKVIMLGIFTILSACHTPSTISTSKTIEVYKSDESRQCQQFEISLGEMQKQLGDIHVYQARKGVLGDAFASVCGGQTGGINIYRIANVDVEKAKSKGFKILPVE